MLAEADKERALRQIERVVRELQPQVLLTWPSDGVSGHPDHVAISHWTYEVFQRANDLPIYPGGPLYAAAALYHIVVPRSVTGHLKMASLQAVPDDAVTCRIDASAVWEQKMAAIRCHRSQMRHSPILNRPLHEQRLFLSTEHFRLARARPELFSEVENGFCRKLQENAS